MAKNQVSFIFYSPWHLVHGRDLVKWNRDAYLNNNSNTRQKVISAEKEV